MPQNSKISYSLYQQGFLEPMPCMGFAQKFNGFDLPTTSFSDYNCFGMPLEGRTYSESASSKYPFGMNGQMKDDEIYGEGNTYSAQYWEYDARLGRRWNLDPKPAADISQYSCFANNPILYADPNGDIIRIEGNIFFKVRTMIVIATMMSTKEGMRIVANLQNDPKDWVIKNSKDGSFHNKGVVYIDYSKFKNSKGTYEDASLGQDVVSNVGHEMRHQDDYRNGILNSEQTSYIATYDSKKNGNDFVSGVGEDGRPYNTPLKLQVSEVSATTTENLINAERGKPLRVFKANQFQQILKDGIGLDGTDFTQIKPTKSTAKDFIKNFSKVAQFKKGIKL